MSEKNLEKSLELSSIAKSKKENNLVYQLEFNDEEDEEEETSKEEPFKNQVNQKKQDSLELEYESDEEKDGVTFTERALTTDQLVQNYQKQPSLQHLSSTVSIGT